MLAHNTSTHLTLCIQSEPKSPCIIFLFSTVLDTFLGSTSVTLPATTDTQITVNVDIIIIDDDTLEDDEIFIANLTTSQKNINVLNGVATITIIDDDSEYSLTDTRLQ